MPFPSRPHDVAHEIHKEKTHKEEYVFAMHRTVFAMNRSAPRWRIPSAVLLAFVGVAAAISFAVRAAHAAPAAHVIISPSSTPAYSNDAGDPDPLYSNGTYYAFTTGTTLGNHIQALT